MVGCVIPPYMVNNPTDTRETLIAEFADLVDRAIALGQDEALARIRQAVRQEPEPQPSKQKPQPPKIGNGHASFGYGGIKNLVRRTVVEKKGVTRKWLLANSNRICGQQLTENQIAEALRTLSRDDEIVSRNRKWFPGPNMDREKLGI